MNIRAEDYKIELMKNIEEGGYLAYISQLNCWGDGDTAEEAYAEVIEVANDILEMAKDDGVKIPAPQNKIIEEGKCSGRISLRTTKSLHAQLIRRAEKEGCSLNHLINEYLAMGIGMEYGKEKLTVNIENVECRINEVQESLIKKDSDNWLVNMNKNIERKLAMKGGI